MLYFEGLTPSPCGHSLYLIYDEQRESKVSSWTAFIRSDALWVFSLLPAVSRNLTGCFAQQNIEGVVRSDGGVEYHQKSIRLLFLATCRGDRNVVADKRFIVNIQVCPHEFSTESVCSFCSAFDLYYLWQKSDIGCDSAKKQMDLFFLLSSCTIFVPIKRV